MQGRHTNEALQAAKRRPPFRSHRSILDGRFNPACMCKRWGNQPPCKDDQQALLWAGWEGVERGANALASTPAQVAEVMGPALTAGAGTSGSGVGVEAAAHSKQLPRDLTQTRCEQSKRGGLCQISGRAEVMRGADCHSLLLAAATQRACRQACFDFWLSKEGFGTEEK